MQLGKASKKKNNAGSLDGNFLTDALLNFMNVLTLQHWSK